MSDDMALVDTNVLVYALYRESAHHERCRALLDQAQAGQIDLCVAPQNLAEFYAIVTDPRRVATPRQPAEALDVIDRILAMPGMTLLSMPNDVVQRWMALSRQRPALRGAIFDLQLVATMLGNGVRKIYTFDRSDFEPFGEIEVLTP
jgi:toxin-antitoxin system PIN domain toxin